MGRLSTTECTYLPTWFSLEGGLVDEFLHALEDSFSHNEVWPQP